jgi:hypothetical protein
MRAGLAENHNFKESFAADLLKMQQKAPIDAIRDCGAIPL